jgi:molybdopterin/thiamine biosynthesis adenylyltransferase
MNEKQTEDVLADLAALEARIDIDAALIEARAELEAIVDCYTALLPRTLVNQALVRAARTIAADIGMSDEEFEARSAASAAAASLRRLIRGRG